MFPVKLATAGQNAGNRILDEMRGLCETYQQRRNLSDESPRDGTASEVAGETAEETERMEEMKVCDMCKKEIKSAPFMTGHFPYVTVAITESVANGMRVADLCEYCQL